MAPESVIALVQDVFGEGMHAKRVDSLAMAALGVVHAASLTIHAIGRGLAAAAGLNAKHATKQVDRLLSNTALALPSVFGPWVKFVVGERKEIVVALDWTEFDDDDQSTIALYLVTSHGRATPLVWQAVKKSTLKNKRNGYEDNVIDMLSAALEDNVRVTLLADRGFGDRKRYSFIAELGWHYVIRFRQGIKVTNSKGETRTAKDWLFATGRARLLKNARVTGAGAEVGAVVLVHAKRMKDPWCLATNLPSPVAATIVKLYGRRFTIEETFRDTKDIHFGMGLKATHIGKPERRDRLLLLGAIAHALLTLLGAAGERAGLDRLLKTNTSAHRTLSLYRQGCFWYDALPNMPDERYDLLVAAFDNILAEQKFFRGVFGKI